MLFGTAVFWLLSFFTPYQRVRRQDWPLFALGGVVMAGTLYAFSEAFRYTSPCYVSLVSAMSPLLVMLMAALFLKEPISWKKSIGVLFGICGALMIVLFSWGVDANMTAKGLMFCTINILFYAGYLLITRSVSGIYSPITLMRWIFLIGTPPCVALAIPSFRTSATLMTSATPFVYLNLLTVLIFATIVSYFLLPIALRQLRPTTVSMYSNLQPVVTSVVAIAAGQDVFTWNKPVALILIVMGVYLVNTSRAKGQG